MNRIDFEGKVVWVTGASAGMGRSVSRELANRGAEVALSARREKKLEEVSRECGEDQTSVFPLDVTERSRNQEVVDSIVDHFGGLDIAFFNAGVFGTLGEQAFDADVFEWNMNVNYFGVIYGIEAALPHLRKSDAGYLVGMSSAAAYSQLARGSSYGSSKSAVKYMLNSLDHEWSSKGVDVDVSVICPGVVKTPMTETDDFPYESPPSYFEVSSEWAGNYIVNQMEKRKHEISFPFLFILSMKFLGILPNPFHRWILKLMDKVMVSRQ